MKTTTNMFDLTQLPNIDHLLANKLKEAGIHSGETLRALGGRKAFILLKAGVDPTVSVDTLYALEGAVQGISWHQLTPERKRELEQLFTMFEKNNEKAIGLKIYEKPRTPKLESVE